MILREVKLVVRSNSNFFWGGGGVQLRQDFALKIRNSGYPPKVKDLRSAFLIAIYAKSIEYADSLRNRCVVTDFMA